MLKGFHPVTPGCPDTFHLFHPANFSAHNMPIFELFYIYNKSNDLCKAYTSLPSFSGPSRGKFCRVKAAKVATAANLSRLVTVPHHLMRCGRERHPSSFRYAKAIPYKYTKKFSGPFALGLVGTFAHLPCNICQARSSNLPRRIRSYIFFTTNSNSYKFKADWPTSCKFSSQQSLAPELRI